MQKLSNINPPQSMIANPGYDLPENIISLAGLIDRLTNQRIPCSVNNLAFHHRPKISKSALRYRLQYLKDHDLAESDSRPTGQNNFIVGLTDSGYQMLEECA